MTEPLSSLIRALEAALQDPAVRSSRARLDELLADEFAEIGRSGRRHAKGDTLARLPAQEAHSQYAMQDFALRELAAGTVLATYRLEERAPAGGPALSSLRSSIWQLRGGRWQLVFHQGTPLASPSGAEPVEMRSSTSPK
jgi:hypothetical protein